MIPTVYLTQREKAAPVRPSKVKIKKPLPKGEAPLPLLDFRALSIASTHELFLKACKKRNEQDALRLLKRGVSSSIRIQNIHTILSFAIQLNWKEVTQYILEKEKLRWRLLNVQDHQGNTPLLQAARLKHKEIARLLLQAHGVKKHTSNLIGETFFSFCIKNNWLDIATEEAPHPTSSSELYLCCAEKQKKFLPFFSMTPKEISSICFQERSLLHWAILNEWDDVITSLLQNPETKTSLLNKTDRSGVSPLLLACLQRNKKYAELLIDHGANLHITSASKPSILHFIISSRWTDLFYKVFSKYKAHERPPFLELRDTFGNTPLLLAAVTGQKELVLFLLKKYGFQVQLTNDGCSLLTYASLYDWIEIAGEFILPHPEAGKLITAQDDQLDTPLLLACKNGHRTMASILLREAKSLFTQKDKLGFSVLSFAVYNNWIELVPRILSNEHAAALINAPTNKGMTPLLFATNAYNRDLMRILLDYGANPFIKYPQKNYTPFHALCQMEEEQWIETFVKRGNIPLLLDPQNGTLLHYALKYASPSLLDYILSKSPQFDVLQKTTTGKTAFDLFKKTSRWQSARRKMEIVAIHLFPHFPKLLTHIQQHDIADLETHLLHHPDLLDCDLQKGNPLEVAFFFQNFQLGTCLRTKLGEHYPTCVAKLHARFPRSNPQDFTYNIEHQIDPSHFALTPKDIPIQEKPPHSSVDELLTLFDSINFSHPHKPNYFALPDSETPISSRKTLENMVKNIKNRTPYLGTPPAKAPQLLEAFYTNIENALCHTVHALHKMDPAKSQDLKVTTVLDLLKAAPLCGYEVSKTVSKYYNIVVGGITDSPQNYFYSLFGECRKSVLESLTPPGEHNTHTNNKIILDCGPAYSIPETSYIQKLNDIFIDQTYDTGPIRREFEKLLIPSLYMNWLKNALQGAECWDKMIDLLKQIVPPSFNPAEKDPSLRTYGYIESLNTIDQNGKKALKDEGLFHALHALQILR